MLSAYRANGFSYGLLRLRDTTGGRGRTVNTQIYNFHSDSYTVFSLGRDENYTPPSCGKKNGVATIYVHEQRSEVARFRDREAKNSQHKAHFRLDRGFQ